MTARAHDCGARAARPAPERRPPVSLIMPARNAEATIAPALESVFAQDYSGAVEVIVADGSDTPATGALVRRRFPGVRVVANPEGTISAGLNRALGAASHAIVARCDAHSVLPPGYLARAVATLERTGAANVGGRVNPVGTTRFGRAVALTTATALGAGDSRYRVDGREGPTDMVFPGLFRRDALDAAGGWDETLLANEDYELNWRLRARGETVWFDPAIAVDYRPRGSVGALARQYFAYGRWKRAVLARHPRSLRARQLAAPLLLAALAASAALAAVAALVPLPAPAPSVLAGAAAAPALGYVALLLGGAAAIGVRRRRPEAVLVPVAAATIHLAWAAGFFAGPGRRFAVPRHGATVEAGDAQVERVAAAHRAGRPKRAAVSAPAAGAATGPQTPASGRIALFVRTLGAGGVPTAMLAIAHGLAERGFAVDLLVFNQDAEVTRPVSGNVRLIDLGIRRLALGLPALAGYLKKERPLLLIAASPDAVLLALLAKRLLRPGVRTWARQDNFFSMQLAHAGRKTRMVLKLTGKLLPSADEVIAVSAGVARDLERRVPRVAGAVRVVHNPVPHDRIAASAAMPVDHPWFGDRDVPVVLSAGRLVGQKDFPTLIRAFAQVLESGPARLVILGSGRERDALAALARDLGVAHAVDLPGFVANPFPWMSRARVFAVSSIYEGLPMVLIEAMACGTPVVSTDCPHGPGEVLENGRWGRLVPVGDAGALARAILETLRNPAAPDALVGRSRAFSVEACIDRHIDLMACRARRRA